MRSRGAYRRAFVSRIPVYDCATEKNVKISARVYPVRIDWVRWIDIVCDGYPNGFIQISCYDAGNNRVYATSFLKSYVNRNGRYAVWGQHRFYEGYAGGIILRRVPDEIRSTVEAEAKKYGTLIE